MHVNEERFRWRQWDIRRGMGRTLSPPPRGVSVPASRPTSSETIWRYTDLRDVAVYHSALHRSKGRGSVPSSETTRRYTDLRDVAVYHLALTHLRDVAVYHPRGTTWRYTDLRDVAVYQLPVFLRSPAVGYCGCRN